MKLAKLSLLAIAAGLFIFCFPAAAAELERQRSTMDFGWKFTLGDPSQAQNADFNDSSWSDIDLPHDWSIYGPFDKNAPAGGSGGYLPTGIGWYRKTFKLPESVKSRQIQIEFDGVYENSEVWINGHSLGVRPYGYSSFIYDLTPYLKFDQANNVIAVRVDNSPQPNSRWYAGSGIYRHTWLLVSDDLHIPQWGTYVTTPQVTADSATIHARIELTNQRKGSANFSLDSILLDKDGQPVQTVHTVGALDAGSANTFEQEMQIAKPKLWSPQNPYLYTLRCQIHGDNQLIDQYDTPVGIRSAFFDVNRGFVLNGMPIKLNGVCLHGDGGGVGTAVPEGVWARRLQLLKDMGCNAIRTSHNPPTPEFLDICDQMGFLVMDEAFDEWEQGKKLYGYHIHFKQWGQRDLVDFVHRDRNHPSVILWSAGNEIGEQSATDGPAILKKLVDTFHAEDPTRPVTAACDRIYAEPTSTLVEFTSLLDVVGYNYVDRWRDRTDKYYSIDRLAFPSRKFIGTESSSMSEVRGDYHWLLKPPINSPASHSKWERLPVGNTRIDVEQLYKFVRTNDYVSGDFMWTGIAYLGENSWPNKSAFYGPLDTCGFKKDSYYFYQSQWTDTPVLHLLPHWNLQGHEGEVIPVTGYTNCDTVELFLNGKSFGTKGYEFPRHGMEKSYGIYPPRAYMVRTTADLHLSWDVPYEPGVLKAVGTMKGQTITQEVATTGDPAAIRLSVDRPSLTSDGRDVAHITVEIIDARDRMVPTADNDVTFDISGNAKIISVDNGNPASDESFKSNHRKAFNGMCLAIVQTTRNAGAIHITARSSGLRDAALDLQSRTSVTK